MKNISIILFTTILLYNCSKEHESSKRDRLLNAIGILECPNDLNIDTLEAVSLSTGIRYKVEYTVLQDDTVFGFPEKRITAYLFVPMHDENAKLPGVIALHQYGMIKKEWGKKEPAGLAGDSTLFYGLELFNRGYIVICPDRAGFGERNGLSERAKQWKGWLDSECDTNRTKEWGDMFEFFANYPIITLKGSTLAGLETSELMVAIDVLESLDCIDKTSIGAVGHSGGGIALVPLMLADLRIKAGVSSCGFEKIESKYHADSDMFWDIGSPIFGLLNIGISDELVSQIAPRSILFTKGKYEYGKWNEEQIKRSERDIKDFQEMIAFAKKNYAEHDAEDNIQEIIFSDNNGRHSFPEKVKTECYLWLDNKLNKKVR